IFGSAVLAFTLYAPALTLFALPLAVAFSALAPLNIRGQHAGPIDLLLGSLVVAATIRVRPQSIRRLHGAGATPLAWLRGLERREPLRFAVFAALLAYLAVVALSLVVATSRAATVKELIKWGEVTVLVGLGLWLLRSPREVRVLAWGMIAAGVAEA